MGRITLFLNGVAVKFDQYKTDNLAFVCYEPLQPQPRLPTHLKTTISLRNTEIFTPNTPAVDAVERPPNTVGQIVNTHPVVASRRCSPSA